MITFSVLCATAAFVGMAVAFALAWHVLRVAHTSQADQSTINLDDEFHKREGARR